jgi:hypothetical protein
VEEKQGDAKKQHRRSSSCPADLQVTEHFYSADILFVGLVAALI